MVEVYIPYSDFGVNIDWFITIGRRTVVKELVGAVSDMILVFVHVWLCQYVEWWRGGQGDGQVAAEASSIRGGPGSLTTMAQFPVDTHFRYAGHSLEHLRTPA